MKVSTFFRHPESILVFMTNEAIEWMQYRNIPASAEERDRLIYRIYEARIMMILSRCGVAAVITSLFYMTFLAINPLTTFWSTLPYYIGATLILQFAFDTLMQTLQFGIFNSRSGSDSENELADDEELDYLRDPNP